VLLVRSEGRTFSWIPVRQSIDEKNRAFNAPEPGAWWKAWQQWAWNAATSTRRLTHLHSDHVGAGERLW
jgi:hypothetical protein